MAKNQQFAMEFGSKVVLPTILTTFFISMLILYLFSTVFKGTEAIDRAMAQSSGQAILKTLRHDMEGLGRQEASRDSAIAGQPAQRWFTSNFNVHPDAALYDTAFVVDFSGHTVAAWIAGKVETSGPGYLDYFGPAAVSLIEKLRTNAGVDVVSGFLARGKAVSVVAAARVKPAMAPDAPELALILAKTIDSEILTAQAGPSQLSHLHFASGSEARGPSVELVLPDGEPLTQMVWDKRTSTSFLQARLGPLVWAVQALLLLVVGFLVYLSWRGFIEAEDSRADALAAALRDDLTGLANRRQLMAVLSERMKSARKVGSELSVVYADLDGFKEVNDAYGHEIGDQLLRATAAGFSFLAGNADVVARLGGDEFAIIVSGAGARAQARKLAADMIAFLAEPMTFGGRVASVSVSVGIVDLEPGIVEIEEMLRRADIAMYGAKGSGRNRVQLYDPALDQSRDEARAIARELRVAIDEARLQIVYQPIVDAASRCIRGAEALVRWPAASRRSVSPDIFVTIAEKFGLIEDLGQFVLAEACRQATYWPDLFISVNVSPIQFMNPNFAEIVAATLRQTGLAPERLELEVTEGFIIDNAERATALIGQLHRMQVKISLDDFGTGYSSIGHLRRFKFDKLKLDRSMVVDVLRQPSALRLVQGTVAMADALGLKVTAEGVEEENQVPVLRLAGCGLFQGYLFSQPITAQDLTQLLQHEMAEAG